MGRTTLKIISLCLGLGFPAVHCTVQVDAGDYVNACEPGYERCSNNEIQRCREDGGGFMVMATCEDNEACQNATCIPVSEVEITASESNFVETEKAIDEGEGSGGSNRTSPGSTPPPVYVFDGTVLGLKFQVLDSLDGGYIDLGLCGGVPTDGPDFTSCSSSLFYRIENTGNQLSGTLYQIDGNDEFIVHEGTALNIVEGEIYEFIIYKDSTTDGEDDYSVTISLSGASYGSAFYLATIIPDDTFESFGLWNFRKNGGSEEALSGSVVHVEITRGLEITINLMDFIQFTALEEFDWQLDRTAEIAEFYVTGEAANSAFFPVQILESEETNSAFSP